MANSMMLRSLHLLPAVLAVVAAACAHEPAQSGPVGMADPETGSDFEYRIGPADVLQIIVWKNDLLTRQVPVRPDGMISLPLVHEVRAAGLTPMQLGDVLKSRLAEYLSNADISVMVTEINSYMVSVLGEVKAAGRYQFASRVTVLDALARAGGVTEFAVPSGIFVLRHDGAETRKIPFDYEKAITLQEHLDFFVQPGDVVIVP
jgi:polysaccharide export outer membrane protein